MKILLTGAAGFLGSHLTTKLLELDHEVIGMDDLSTGSPKNLASHLTNSNFKFLEQDVRIPFDATVDAILNFACPASPKSYQLDPVRTIETNFLGIINMLRLAKKIAPKLYKHQLARFMGIQQYLLNLKPTGVM